VTDQGPVYGRQAIEKMHGDCSRSSISVTTSSKVDQNAHHVIGPAIWEVGEWSTTIQGQNFGPIEAKGYFSSINVREGDTWKICMLTAGPKTEATFVCRAFAAARASRKKRSTPRIRGSGLLEPARHGKTRLRLCGRFGLFTRFEGQQKPRLEEDD
jgi:Domain of unknown function (DUF4440)